MKTRIALFILLTLVMCLYLMIMDLYVDYADGPPFYVPQGVQDREIVLVKSDRNTTFRFVKDLFISEQRMKLKLMEKPPTSKQPTVTMASQTLIDNLHLLVSLSEKWDGPISVSILIDRVESHFLGLVKFFYQCIPRIRANTSFHLLYPAHLKLSFPNVECDSYMSIKHRRKENMKLVHVEDMKYPHNLMRNLALPDDMDGFVFFIDIDMVPSLHLHDQFLHFVSRMPQPVIDSSIFIVPLFESKSLEFLPETKRQLLLNKERGDVRQFHEKICWWCQLDTNYTEWENTASSTVSYYKIERYFCAFEPMYIISRLHFLPYDERFIGRGYNRVSQISELWMSGFNFHVLTDVFLVHRGFHTPPPIQVTMSISTTTPLSQTSPPATLSPQMYEKRHLDFLRAKYLENDDYRKQILKRLGPGAIQRVEERLLVNVSGGLHRKREEVNTTKWLKQLTDDDVEQYKLFMMYGENGPTTESIYEEKDEPYVFANRTFDASDCPDIEKKYHLMLENPEDPNRMLFLQFLCEKANFYSYMERRRCRM